MSVFAMYAAVPVAFVIVATAVYYGLDWAFPCKVIPRNEEDEPFGDASLLGREEK